MKNIYEKIETSSKPRVHIKYEVETEEGVVEKELPFVIGVMGDFSGNSTENSKPLSERKFVEINRDNFNDVMSNIKPSLNLRIENKLSDDGSQMAINLEFKSIEDFNPENIVEQIPDLKKLLETRNKLRDLLTQVDRSEKLESVLESLLQNDKILKLISQEESKEK
ncbi:MAG: hypothetical protein ACD_79C01310G0005 [uncultured bacterium]|nr:MAG: hypothetical protein ACD_79C01310G0005 [uncultured bacterium]OGT24937.1 MAG: type VI secretion system-associated protein [Gammaproteobacteria bacterium RIFCSPHIGHO2_12_38_15]OGT67865.1 MAG: type VI secretion system-associated protein [Gammaproteobacteria bacterium RIFCSPLOWO2_02_FULL_38_11]